ncbi:MAG: hypothetical protein KDJ65_04815 [Anaerolineae bacterium]|nr:hypothetical protein [Anaerolineae bacterium]
MTNQIQIHEQPGPGDLIDLHAAALDSLARAIADAVRDRRVRNQKNRAKMERKEAA